MSDDEKVKYVLELDVPGLMKGEGIEIPGLGVFENGDSYEITETQAENYRQVNSTVEAVVDEETNAILGSEVTKGMTLLQASKGMMEGITVATYSSSDEDEPDEAEPDDDEDEIEDPVLANQVEALDNGVDGGDQ